MTVYVGINAQRPVARETWLFVIWFLVTGALAGGLIYQTEALAECRAEGTTRSP